MSASPPRVAILILNWNDKRNTLETLASINGLEYPNFEVWVADNGSIDGSPEAVGTQFPDVRVIRSPLNLGIPGGRNFGLEPILRGSDVNYVMILDNDVAVEPRLLDKLVAAAEAEGDLGIVGPTLYYYSDPERIWSAGARIVFREVTAKSPARNRLVKGERPEGIERVDCLTGCCVLVKRRVFETIGRFNPQYFFVGSTMDFCYRAAKQGFGTAVVTHAKLWHKVSASTGGGYRPARAYFTGRSTILFLKEHGRLWNWITTLTFATLGLSVAYFRERRRRNQRAVAMKLRGYLDGLLGRPVDPEVEQWLQLNHTVPTGEQYVQRRA